MVLKLLEQHNILAQRTIQGSKAIILEESATKITPLLIAKIIDAHTQDLQSFSEYLKALLGGEKYEKTPDNFYRLNNADILFTDRTVAEQCCRLLKEKRLTATVHAETKRVSGQTTEAMVYVVSIEHACQANEVFKDRQFLKQLTEQLHTTYVAQLTAHAHSFVLN